MAFCAALFVAAASTTLSSATPFARPVSLENSSSTLFTLPGPSTICIVSSSTRPITPSSALIPSVSTLPVSLTVTRRRVMHAAFASTLSLPPKRSNSFWASSLFVITPPCIGYLVWMSYQLTPRTYWTSALLFSWPLTAARTWPRARSRATVACSASQSSSTETIAVFTWPPASASA